MKTRQLTTVTFHGGPLDGAKRVYEFEGRDTPVIGAKRHGLHGPEGPEHIYVGSEPLGDSESVDLIYYGVLEEIDGVLPQEAT